MPSSAAARLVKADWGWTYVPAQSNILSNLFDSWLVLLSFYGLYLCLRHYLRRIERKQRRQAGLVALGTFFPLTLALTT